MNIFRIAFVLFILSISGFIDLSRATVHLFLCEDEKIFSDCDDKPNALGVESMLDLSDIKVEILDDTVSLEGSVRVVWDVEPSDRIDFKADLLKAVRGGWQPTIFTMVQKDLCRNLFDESNIWYKSWGQFVDENDRKCVNEKGTVYHHMPFNVELSVDIEGEKMSGRHKIEMVFEAYNGADEKRSEVCIQVLLDVIQK